MLNEIRKIERYVSSISSILDVFDTGDLGYVKSHLKSITLALDNMRKCLESHKAIDDAFGYNKPYDWDNHMKQLIVDVVKPINDKLVYDVEQLLKGVVNDGGDDSTNVI